MVENGIMRELIARAAEVRENSYSPYSRFKVGAALLAKSGTVYCGCNYENVSFGAVVCAERVALGNALSAGEREFIALAVCAGDMPTTPCGICRQSLIEFGDIDVFCCDASGEKIESHRLSDLLPGAFSHFDSD